MLLNISRIFALILFIFFLPFLAITFIFIKLTSKGTYFFRQKRMGKNKRPFWIYKIRSMKVNAEFQRKHVFNLNEVDGPVFKIYNDPRYTKIGKFLSHTGLDELPQLINIIKGEMAFVGPRPLPVNEALKVPSKYKKRFSVLPGITSPWILLGAHKLSFKEWMESDLAYIKNKSVWYDFVIFNRSCLLILKFIFKKVFKINEKA